MGCLSFLLVVACTAAQALEILSPAAVAGTYHHTESRFGIPHYGESVQAQLVFFPSDAEGCAPYNRSRLKELAPGLSKIIVLVERGRCTFVKKVRDAQALQRAQAVVVYDNVGGNYSGQFIMADDGTAGDVRLPSILISNRDGEVLRQGLSAASAPVIAKISWAMPSPDDHVEWELWSTSSDLSRYEVFKLQFAHVARKIGDSGRASFTPRFGMMDGFEYGCDEAWIGTETGFRCGNQCTNQGRYCSEDPDLDLLYGLDGGDVVQENLRQICIRDVVNETTGSLRLWWDYVAAFHTACAPVINHTSAQRQSQRSDCSFAQQRHVGINADAVVKCVKDSGGYSYTGGFNSKLAAEVDIQRSQNVHILPSIRVNGQDYFGKVTCPTPTTMSTCPVLGALCAGFPSEPLGSRPDFCKDDYCWGVRDKCGVCNGNSTSCADLAEDTLTPTSLAIAAGCSIVATICVAAIMHSLARNREASMRLEFQATLAKYAPLDQVVGRAGGNEENDCDTAIDIETSSTAAVTPNRF
eukprot:TRINITY_DN5109_c0_g1_i1.p1 TRINITY_DN5109_c0_g1~~TRINITY_DN5109_c0_g1_i1.p1  ORF type:complete len:525 (+),score=49.88 TRINITY_DN5109_c0_g1_i1:138-1712(+)